MPTRILRTKVGVEIDFDLSAVISQSYFAPFLCAAQRFRCASPMRLRASGLITGLRFLRDDGALVGFAFVPASTARACWRQASSASMVERMLSRLMVDIVFERRPQTV